MTVDTPPKVNRITVFPVKSLDGLPRDRATIAPGGCLDLDRTYAIVDRPPEESYDPDSASPHADYINGKRTAAVYRLRSTFDPAERTLTLRKKGHDDGRTFDVESGDKLDAWLSEYFGQPVSLRREPNCGHPDHRYRGLTGPSVVSTGTLREMASWFDSLDIEDVRRRFRANVEISGVPAFWEDRLYADHGEAVAFRVGDLRLEGVEPCERCVVPTRDPDTGHETEGFRETFIRKRRKTRPPWLDSTRFNHDFRLMVITNVPENQSSETIAVGDPVEINGTHSY